MEYVNDLWVLILLQITHNDLAPDRKRFNIQKIIWPPNFFDHKKFNVFNGALTARPLVTVFICWKDIVIMSRGTDTLYPYTSLVFI